VIANKARSPIGSRTRQCNLQSGGKVGTPPAAPHITPASPTVDRPRRDPAPAIRPSPRPDEAATDPIKLLRSLSADALQARLTALQAEEGALRVLLRSARVNERLDPPSTSHGTPTTAVYPVRQHGPSRPTEGGPTGAA
jgi:hypothetical protein